MEMAPENPFTSRGRITDPSRFVGRWSELSLIFERLEAGRPVLVAGSPGIGKSSLLTHATQSAAINLELDDLRAYYLDIAAAESVAEVYQTVAEALGQPGDTLAALELALVAAGGPVLLCLDNADAPVAAGWGAGLLEALARVARGAELFLVVAFTGEPPPLSEPFATLRLGALAPTEVRLLVESYLEGTGISFTPNEIRQLGELSGAHPAYVQRAAFHLFQSKVDPEVNWPEAYLIEVRVRPIAGAPLPPAVFQGGLRGTIEQSSYGDATAAPAKDMPRQLAVPEGRPALGLLVAVCCAAVVYLITANVLLALGAALLGVFAAGLWLRSGS
jgi:hypothetical protein